MIEFIVPGTPQGKARPRVVSGHAYTPQKTADYENTVRRAWMAAGKPMIPEDKAVEVSIRAYFPIPKRTSKRERFAWMERGRYHTHKPDADNIAKCILDALNGHAYKDDSAVAWLSVTKVYSDEPHVVVRMQAIDKYVMRDSEEEAE